MKYQVAKHWIDKGNKPSLVLKIVGLPKSTYYYYKAKECAPKVKKTNRAGAKPKGYSFNIKNEKVSDDEIKVLLKGYDETRECAYGYRKRAYAVRRDNGIILNHKKAYRLCREMKLLRKYVPQPREKKVLASNKKVKSSNRLWEIDVKYGYIHGIEKTFYVCEIIDVFDRTIIDYHIGFSCTAEDVCNSLIRAVNKRPEIIPEELYIRSDNGTQFTSKLFSNTCRALGINHERIPNATPNKNAHIEAFHSILEREVFGYKYFESFQEAYEEMLEFIEFYNTKRIHGSLKYMTPQEFYEKYKGRESERFSVAA